MVNSTSDMHAHTRQKKGPVLVACSELHPKFRGISGWITGWRVDGYVIKQSLEMLVVKSSWKKHGCSI